MARLFCACIRNAESAETEQRLKKLFERIQARIIPDAVGGNPVFLTSANGFLACCSTDAGGVYKTKTALGLGYIDQSTPGWDRVLGIEPEGTYALVRADDSVVELITDGLATRNLWYYHDPAFFAASTSQRALIMMLGSFEPSKKPVSWFLANGNIGPQAGWDRRLRKVEAATTKRLCRDGWHLETKDRHSAEVQIFSKRAGRASFRQAVKSVIADLDLDEKHWVLPISGGYDSRLIACLMSARGKNLRTITWGMGAGLKGTRAEADVAGRLAGHLGLSHEYVPLDNSSAALGQTLKRFVAFSEGQTDALTGYLDGFKLWNQLTKRGVTGIVRGDEPFGGQGWGPVRTEREVRRGLGLLKLSDRDETNWISDVLDLGAGRHPRLPESLQRRSDESLESWRHRLFLSFRIPVAVASLTETKAAWIELVNPLLFAKVVKVVRRLPAKLRSEKVALIEYCRELSPRVPFKSSREGDQLTKALHAPELVREMRNRLSTKAARRVLPGPLLEGLVSQLPSRAIGEPVPRASIGQSTKTWLKSRTPEFAKRKLRRYAAESPVDPCLLAFRAWIIVETHDLLDQDASSAPDLSLDSIRKKVRA